MSSNQKSTEGREFEMIRLDEEDGTSLFNMDPSKDNGGGKTSHTWKEGMNLFPLHTGLVVCTALSALFMVAAGIFLVVCALDISTMIVSLQALVQRPYPNTIIDGHRTKTNLLVTSKYICFVIGSVSLLLCFLLASSAYCLHRLLWEPRPWARRAWNGMRQGGDKCLVEAGVRDKTAGEQVAMLNENQRREVSKFLQRSE